MAWWKYDNLIRKLLEELDEEFLALTIDQVPLVDLEDLEYYSKTKKVKDDR